MRDFTVSSALAHMLVQSGTMGTCLENYEKYMCNIDEKKLITCSLPVEFLLG
jgi:hypothetical protein